MRITLLFIRELRKSYFRNVFQYKNTLAKYWFNNELYVGRIGSRKRCMAMALNFPGYGRVQHNRLYGTLKKLIENWTETYFYATIA